MIFDRAFTKLTAEERETLLLLAERQDYADGQLIVEQGAPSRGLYVLARGGARVQHLFGVVRETVETRPDGTKARVAVPGHLVADVVQLGPGAVFGEMAFVDDRRTSARILAQGAATVLFIDGEVVRDHVAANPDFGTRFYHSLAVVLSRRLRAANENNRRKASAEMKQPG